MNTLEQITSIIGSTDFIRLNKNLQINNDTTEALNFLCKLLKYMSQEHKTMPLAPSTNCLTPPILPIPPLSMSPNGTSHVPPSTHDIPLKTPCPTAPLSHADLPRVQLQRKLNQVCQRHKVNCSTKYSQTIHLRKIAHIYDSTTGKKLTLRALLRNPKSSKIWSKSASNEYGRLLQGNQYGVKGTNTMAFIEPHNIPTTKTITYASMVRDHRPLKAQQYCCRLVVGGDKLPYDDDAAAPAANLLETKLLSNSTISQPTLT